MATTKKKLNKAFISVGKLKDENGVEQDEFITISEDLAKYIGAKYTTKPPAPKKIAIKNGKLKGRTIERQHSVSITGRKYHVGFVQSSRQEGKKRVVKIKWVPIHCPYNMNTRQFIERVVAKLSKRPSHVKTPDGKSTPVTLSK